MTNTPKTLLLKRLRLKNVYGFENAQLDFMYGAQPSRHCIITGENNAGKTALLRALAIALCPLPEIEALYSGVAHIIREGADAALIELELFDPGDPHSHPRRIVTTIAREPTGDVVIVRQRTEPGAFPWKRTFVAGYGAGRGARARGHHMPPARHPRLDAVRTLFGWGTLLEAEGALQALKLADAELTGRSNFVGAAERLLSAVFGCDLTFEVNAAGVWVRMPHPKQKTEVVRFARLSDGYRAAAGWGVDLIRRAHVAGWNGRSPLSGVVLIDEIGEHLHWSRQRTLLAALAKALPHLQIVATTHSEWIAERAGVRQIVCERSGIVQQ